MTVQTTENLSFFDPRNPARNQTLLQTQFDPESPTVAQLRRGTNLLVPDSLVATRLAHFPDDLYDLRQQSHLVRFLKALLGEAGAGGIRKRYLIARLQQALRSTHFYDLDRFYGALFGAQRLRVERLPYNPMLSTGSGDDWDRVHAADTHYRERIMALAKAIPLGATVPGMKAAAEAVIGFECDILETWRSIAFARSHGYRTRDDQVERQWRQVESLYSNYALMEGNTWAALAGVDVTSRAYNRTMAEVEDEFGTYGNIDTGSVPALTYHDVQFRTVAVGRVRNDRTEFIVAPKKHYPATPAGRMEKAQDEYALRKVLNTLKPEASRLTIDQSSDRLAAPITLGKIESDSNYYEIQTRITPRISAGLSSSTYPLAPEQRARRVDPGDERVLPRPPFSATEGTAWTYNNEVVAVRSYMEGPDGNRRESNSYQLIPTYTGEVQEFGPDKGVLDARQAEAMRLASDGVLISHPYSQDRQAVPTHD